MQRALLFAVATLTVCSPALTAPANADDKELPLEVVRTFKALNGMIDWVAFSPDESVVAIGSRNSDTLFLYDVETGKERTRIKLDAAPRDPFAFVFSGDGKTLAWRDVFRQQGGVVRTFDTATGKELRQFAIGFRNGVGSYSSDFSPDGKQFAIVVTNSRVGVEGPKTVEVWNVENGKIDHTDKLNDEPGSCVFSPDGKMIATQDVYGQVRIWDAKGKKLHEFDRATKSRAPASLSLLAWSPDSKRVAACGFFTDDSAIMVWDVTTGKPVQTITPEKQPGRGLPSALVFTPHAKWVGVSFNIGVNRDLNFYDIESGKKVGHVKAPPSRGGGGGFEERSVVFTRSGKYLTGGGPGVLSLYALRKGTEKTETPFVVPTMESEIKPKGIEIKPKD